jgi:hypothetical protein
MSKLKTEIKDTTIKDKSQPLDLTPDAAEVLEESEAILQQSGVEVDEDKLIEPRPDSDKAV